MNVAFWYAFDQTTNKQLIHGAFTLKQIRFNKKSKNRLLSHSCILLILAPLPFNFIRP